MRDMQEARDKVVDALWWMRGFAANSEGGSVEHDLARKLLDVNAYLAQVQTGEVRRLGEETAIVMTYGEFERLVDAVRGRPTLEDVKLAVETVDAILAAYRREDERARRDANPEIPF